MALFQLKIALSCFEQNGTRSYWSIDATPSGQKKKKKKKVYAYISKLVGYAHPEQTILPGVLLAQS